MHLLCSFSEIPVLATVLFLKKRPTTTTTRMKGNMTEIIPLMCLILVHAFQCAVDHACAMRGIFLWGIDCHGWDEVFVGSKGFGGQCIFGKKGKQVHTVEL